MCFRTSYGNGWAWNKLFRRSFYLEQQVKWVEGHLYEDIPATIPAHYNARRIAFLNKVVYRWRVRDGQTRSITQNRNEIRNFRDRLYALQRVDEFFAAHVTEPALIEAKEFKWLDLDLKLSLDHQKPHKPVAPIPEKRRVLLFQ